MERARVSLERKVKQHSGEWDEREKISSFDSEDAFYLRRAVQEREFVMIEFCKQLLQSPNQTVRDRFEIDDDGAIDFDRDGKLGQAASLPILLREKYDSGVDFNAEDVRQAMKKIADVFPEIRFEFTQTHNAIEYVATIVPAKE